MRYAGLPPEPIVRRYREDGWTPDVQREFIEILALTGSVTRAANAVNRSPSSAYRVRARPDAAAFRKAWEAATGFAYQRLHEIAMDRVINGVEAPVIDKQGDLVYVNTIYNDRLLMFMLNHLRPDRQPLAADERVERVEDGGAVQLADALQALDGAPVDVPAPLPPRSPYTEREEEQLREIDAAFAAMHAENAARPVSRERELMMNFTERLDRIRAAKHQPRRRKPDAARTP